MVAIDQSVLVCRVNVSSDLSEWLHSNGHEDGLHMSCCGDVSEVYAKSSSFSRCDFGKSAVLVSFLLIPSQNSGRK